MSQYSSNAMPTAAELAQPPPVASLAKRVSNLIARHEFLKEQCDGKANELTRLREYLDIHTRVTEALEQLNQQLFQELLSVIEQKLTIALQEVLDQPIKLRATPEWKRNAASVEFHIERDGQAEHIMKGQGGSVANILSVGLRMFALTTLAPAEHRRFLVFDEQDCWVRPDLVPRLVKIVHDAAHALGFQTLMISHHDVGLFAAYADRIYRLQPTSDDGVRVEHWAPHTAEPDDEEQGPLA
jgi:ABC-type glutathione transport system ATPase component